MAFVVEDGTGLANATSLLSVAAADTIWIDRGGHAGWAAANTTQKQGALVKASDYIRNQKRYRWRGVRKTYAQAMPWPRTGVVERDGPEVPDNVVPKQVELATGLLAARALTEELQPDLAHGGFVTQETVGPISTSYAPGAPGTTSIQAADGVLAPLLRSELDPTGVTFEQPEIPAAYVEGEFDYP